MYWQSRTVGSRFRSFDDLSTHIGLPTVELPYGISRRILDTATGIVKSAKVRAAVRGTSAFIIFLKKRGGWGCDGDARHSGIAGGL